MLNKIHQPILALVGSGSRSGDGSLQSSQAVTESQSSNESALTSLWITFCTLGVFGEEYGSFDYSRPPFHYMRSGFECHSKTQKIIWDSLIIEVHPGAANGCAVAVTQSDVSIILAHQTANQIDHAVPFSL